MKIEFFCRTLGCFKTAPKAPNLKKEVLSKRTILFYKKEKKFDYIEPKAASFGAAPPFGRVGLCRSSQFCSALQR